MAGGGFGGGFGPGFGQGFGGEGGETPDTIPDDFLIAQRTNMPVSTVIQSAPFTVSGIDAASPWEVDGLELSINGGAFSDVGGTVENGDSLIVQLTSSDDPGDAVSGTLTIGGVTGTFMVITASEGVSTPFPRKGGGVCPPRGASQMDWALFHARQKNRARRMAAQG